MNTTQTAWRPATCRPVHHRMFHPVMGSGSRFASCLGGAHMTVRQLLLRVCALGLLLLLNTLSPQAGIVALASCLAHLPGPPTAEADREV
jgi:hypothetical protein